jgi:hypothetical protein
MPIFQFVSLMNEFKIYYDPANSTDNAVYISFVTTCQFVVIHLLLVAVLLAYIYPIKIEALYVAGEWNH